MSSCDDDDQRDRLKADLDTVGDPEQEALKLAEAHIARIRGQGGVGDG